VAQIRWDATQLYSLTVAIAPSPANQPAQRLGCRRGVFDKTKPNLSIISICPRSDGRPATRAGERTRNANEQPISPLADGRHVPLGRGPEAFSGRRVFSPGPQRNL